MPKLIITRGLPASGKTTRAKAWVAEDPIRRARVNRDDLRDMLNEHFYAGRDTEITVLAARDALITGLLSRGLDVVCDDTNLPQRTARDVARIGRLAGAEIEVWDLTDVSLETCLERSKTRIREDSVEDQVILDMYTRYLAGRKYPLPLPDDETDNFNGSVYIPDLHLPSAVVVDIDGTVALKGNRSPFDETRVHEDAPNLPVIRWVQMAWDNAHEIVFVSGRTDTCEEATVEWLKHHIQRPFHGPFMRKSGDMRNDATVKRELFDKFVRPKFNVQAVLDDRQRVVDMWRQMGLTVLQVAPGNF